ncbi:glycosyltransferase [Dermatobacter hominis]|uniref:glycosyltransferase n=1 Tax=Dermatobacter hominis TaxID=2884263 RepID=UPI001D104518|nr:glycosyltransferase family 2 protein [Dermatobacter hominis]UDY36333.1 glycosyltransferase family 2 protein [Dermatobacter hominis]
MDDATAAPAPAPLLSVVTPTYNESENIPILVDEIHAALDGIPHEIVVADDDSPDGTWEVAEKLAVTDPTIRVMRRFHDKGLSAAVLDGMSVARGQYLAVIDADLQHDPAALPKMLDAVRAGADVCVGSRSTEGGGYGDWSASRRFVSWVATLIARVLLRVPASDPMSGFFVISEQAYARTAPSINPRGFKILLEFIGRNRGLTVAEVGYTFRNREHGETKLNGSVIRSYLLGVAELRLGRQVDPVFLLYVLVGIVGLGVNSLVFTIAEAFGVPRITTGLNDAVDPIEGSFVISVMVSIFVLFVLNNEFTFWEERYRGWKLAPAFGVFFLMSLVGTLVHVAVFKYLQSIGLLLSVLGTDWSRVAQNLIGATVALVVNWYLNSTYLWRRRQR